MNWEEHLTLIEYSVEKYGDKLCIIGNTGSNSTREGLIATKEGFRAGMHGALQINPYYGKSNPKGVLYHLQSLMDQGPAIIYNVVGRTAQDITPDMVMELAKHPNFAGMKECSGHDRIKMYADKGLICWSGNDDEAHTSRFKHGGHGVISVVSNVVPGLVKRLMEKEDPELDAKLQPLIKWLFVQPNPIGIDTLFMMNGAAQPVFRAPYWPYDEGLRNQVIEILKDFDEKDICGGRPKALKDEDFTVLGDWARGVQHVRSEVDELNSSY
jgi:4-hydroxy-tetrahydrodipicolinate synthase